MARSFITIFVLSYWDGGGTNLDARVFGLPSDKPWDGIMFGGKGKERVIGALTNFWPSANIL